MTEAEKKMKKYVNSVERRLNLPKELKARVMRDFISSIQARRDAGKTDEEIYEELGSAKMAAEDLNEQMKEYTYKKSPWRFLFAVCAAYGASKILGGLWVNICYLFLRVKTNVTTSEAVSVGIIGGADGPTAIFVTTPVWFPYAVPIVLLIVGIWGFIRLGRIRQK